MPTVRLARESERASGEASSSLAAFEGPEFGHFRLEAAVPHPFAWGSSETPIERLIGLDADQIWSVLCARQSVVLGGSAAPIGMLVDDDARSWLPADARLETGGAAIAGLLAMDEVGDPALRAELALAGFEPSDLMIKSLPVPPGSLWQTRFPSMRALYIGTFQASMTVSYTKAYPVSAMIKRDAIAELSRKIGFLFANGDRGLFTDQDRKPCASLRDVLAAHLPHFEIAPIFLGRTVTVDALTPQQLATVRAAGMHVESE